MSQIIKLSSPATEEFWQIPVLFEDGHLLALDKPSHLLTSPDRHNPERTDLMKLLHRDLARGASWARERQLSYLANAHRLDFETTGVILLAKDKPTLIALANQFGSEKPVKKYLALVHGTPQENSFEVEARLAPHPIQIGLVRVDEKQGKKARTCFEVLERFSGFTLLRCQPTTARTHQIRVHLRHRHLPLVGDSLYGGKPLLLSSLKPQYRLKGNAIERPLINRVALLAEELTIVHPSAGTPLTISAPWPKDFSVGVKYLRRYASGGTNS